MASGVVGPVVDVAQSVRAAAERDRSLLMADLEQWVNCDSPSGDPVALDELAALIGDRLERFGASVALAPSDQGSTIRATVEGSGRSRIALLCHHDTVFSHGTASARPFSVWGESAFGPGVADMKGGIAVAVHAMHQLAQLHASRFGRLEFVSVPDEEVRAVAFAGLEELADFDAVFCMECGRPGDGIVTSRKGGHWLTLRVAGRAAHAGVAATSGRSALLAACREVLRISELDGRRDGLGVQVTTLHAGEGLNSIAANASCTIDVRSWHAADLDWALREIERVDTYPGVSLSLETGGRVPPMERTTSVGRLADAALAIGEALGTPLHEVSTGGVSDACWTADAGIPTLDGLGPIGGNDHTPDETIELRSLSSRCGLLAGLVSAVEEATSERKATLVTNEERTK